MKLKMKILALCGAAAAAASFSSAANAHLTTFGWKDNGNGSVTLFAEHWHGAQSSAYSANGGIHISNGTTTILAQWANVHNGVSQASLNLTGFARDPSHYSGEMYNWFSTQAVALGNGTYSFFTGTNCCIDTMSTPLTLTVTGVTSVAPGTIIQNPGAVPEPATWAMMIGGFGMVGGAMRSARRRTKVSVSFA